MVRVSLAEARGAAEAASAGRVADARRAAGEEARVHADCAGALRADVAAECSRAAAEAEAAGRTADSARATSAQAMLSLEGLLKLLRENKAVLEREVRNFKDGADDLAPGTGRRTQ